ncbi:MAG: hypothetical protein KDD15_33115, partial [Lewinella sp.]|nr:hypothetical protein [Lewinella sp.]
MTNLYHYQRLFLFCCFSLMSSNIPAIAQPTVPEFQPEKIFIQTDRQLYITGEIIWFKLFVFDQLGDLSDFSKVAYVELIDGAGTALTQLKIGLENGQGNGAIELPPGLGSGRYQLRAYTQAMRNMGPEAFSYYSLILLHPEQPVVQAVSDQTGVELSGGRIGSSHNNDLKITVRPGREQLGQREKVRMEISSTDATGRPIAADISLAVALTAPGQNEFAIGTTAPLQPPTDIIFRPENKSLLLQGKVSRQSDGEAAHGQEIFLAFPGKTARVYTVATDANGHFSFLLPKMYGLQTVILQTGPEVSEPLRIELEDEFHEIIPTTPKAFTLPSAWLPVANASLINTQVQQAYRAFEKPPVFNTEQTFSEVPFFGRPDVQYRLDDYNRFALPEFFYEIVLEVQVRGKFGEQNISLVNRENHVFEDYPPLLLVDGVPVFDQRTFLKIN